MKTTEEMIEVMQAYKEGKKIEIKYDAENCIWRDCDKPAWNWSSFDYRIKPGHKKRPMTFEEIVEYWKNHRTEIFHYKYEDLVCSDDFIGMITIIDNDHMAQEKIYLCNNWLSVDDFVQYVTKEDGTKFEVEE